MIQFNTSKGTLDPSPVWFILYEYAEENICWQPGPNRDTEGTSSLDHCIFPYPFHIFLTVVDENFMGVNYQGTTDFCPGKLLKDNIYNG